MSKSNIELLVDLKKFIHKGEYALASILIDKLEKKQNFSKEDTLFIRYYKAITLLEEGNINYALDIASDNYPEVNLSTNPLLKINYNYLLGRSNFQLGKLEKGKISIQKIEDIISTTSIEDKHVLNKFNILLKSLKVSYSRFNGKYDEAIKYLNELLELSKRENDFIELYRSYTLIGGVNQEKGEYNLALKNYKLALETAKSGNNQKFIAYALNDIGKIYIDFGDIDLASAYLQERIQLDDAIINDRIDSAFTLYSLGEIEFSKGNHKAAFQLFIDGYTSIELIGASRLESNGLGYLILTCLNLDQLDYAEYYLNIEKELVERTSNKNITGSYNYNRALILRYKKRLIYIVKAQDILEQQLLDNSLSTEIQAKSTILLAEIVVEELKINNNEIVFENLKQLILKLNDYGNSSQIYNVIINNLILQSKFAFIDENFSKGLELLDEAALYTKIKGLTSLSRKVEYEKKSLLEIFNKWGDIGSEFSDKYNEVMLNNFQEYLKEAQKIRSQLK
ncbi:MAG: hypothetical protein HeimC2_12610 [Candidatus Heimdallarchaeota archaeon LC_2]|nr:MAG: hypothetical protein HeimC2_12610 [Candidatus Heimdallarchaeota archaeon LC_2]